MLTGRSWAPVDATLEVGGVEETVTVTGVSPLVDVVSVRQQTVLTPERIQALPGSANVMTAMQYVPGVTGNAYNRGARLHGSDGADAQPHVDGIKSGMQLGSRNEFVGGIGMLTDEMSVQELVFDVSSQSAEYASSGVRSNLIPKAGGNNFSGGVFAAGGTRTSSGTTRARSTRTSGSASPRTPSAGTSTRRSEGRLQPTGSGSSPRSPRAAARATSWTSSGTRRNRRPPKGSATTCVPSTASTTVSSRFVSRGRSPRATS